jgi:transcriptional regulator with XRE-family HTH domain
MIDRFKQVLEQLKLTPSEFADRIGVQRSNISHVLSGRNKPGIDFLEKMLNSFPEVDVAWLITGKPGTQVPLRKEPGNENPVLNNEGLMVESTYNISKKTLLPREEEAVDHIIIVYKNNTFRILNNPEM